MTHELVHDIMKCYRLTLSLPTLHENFAHPREASLFTYSAHFLCSSAAQNAPRPPPAGRLPAGGALCATEKQKKVRHKSEKAHFLS